MLLTKENVAPLEYLTWKPYGDGCEGIGLLRMYGNNFRLQRFDLNAPFDNYCFHSLDAAFFSLVVWNPCCRLDCPDGWVKHIETNRCRPDGDPARESIGWPLPT